MSINQLAIVAAYNRLSDEQRHRFFPGKQYQAGKAIGSLCVLLGENCNYFQLLELYITVIARVTLFPNSDRISITVRMRFSNLVPENMTASVIECIKRLDQNFAYIENVSTAGEANILKSFDRENEGAYKRNESKSEDAIRKPGFGVDPSNPIYAHSPIGSYNYLNLLYTADGIPLTWRRTGQPELGIDSDILDQYELILPNGDVYLSVYVNMYARNTSVYCPAGLHSDNLRDIPSKKTNHPAEDQETNERQHEQYKDIAGQIDKKDSEKESIGKSTPLENPDTSDDDRQGPAFNNEVLNHQHPRVMFCRKCGKKLPSDSSFCQYCGVKVVVVEESTLMANDSYAFRSVPGDKMEQNESIGHYATLFSSHYKTLKSICEEKLFNRSYAEELLPAMFVVVDYAAMSAKKDRKAIADEIMAFIKNHLNEHFSLDVFYSRLDLYGKAIRGKNLRAEWLLGDSNVLSKNAFTRVGGLVGDILINPDCADDYDNAPIVCRDIQEVISFGQVVMWPLVSELVSLFKDIYDEND